jgi:AraC family transcriptional regulator
MQQQFMGLAQGVASPAADPTRPVVRVVYQDNQGRMILLDQQRIRPGQSWGSAETRWVAGEIGLALLGELHADALGGRLYAESLATLLAVQLLRHQSAAGLPTPRRAARLSVAALARAGEYVEEHLADDLSLAALAGAVGLSPWHFARLFRASTGLSPHQYVIRRRVERARLLLTSTDRSLASIAQDVGFASGSHLATHVRRLLRVSPNSLR